MHMADALISPAVGGIMYAASASAVAVAIHKMKKEEASKLPVIGVTAAFVFAAQMINFTIPATGSSGHIGGGVLLAAMLGGFPALLAISAVLLIQCLFFADGGLLALGCNIFNMGVIPCLLAYPLLFKPLTRKSLTTKRITLAAIVTVVAGLQLGALGVVLETAASGISALPIGTFLLLMQPIHLAIGIVEGIITAAVLCFVFQMRPELLQSAAARTASKSPLTRVLAALAVLTVITGGGLSLLASSYPDGLEWSIAHAAGTPELPAQGAVYDTAAALQQRTAFLPDYAFADSEQAIGTSVSGIVGAAMTFVLIGAGAACIFAVKSHKKP